MQESSIITDIIGIGKSYGRKFWKSAVVVTSRPAATLVLCKGKTLRASDFVV